MPDLVSIGRKKGHALSALCLEDSLEARGVNTLAELEALEKLMRYKHSSNGLGISARGSRINTKMKKNAALGKIEKVSSKVKAFLF